MTDMAPPVIPPGILLPPIVPDYSRPRPRVWTVFAAFGAVMLSQVVAPIIGVMIVIPVMKISPDQLANLDARDLIVNPRVMLPLLLAGQLAILAVVVVAALLSSAPMEKRLRLGPSNASWFSMLVFALGAIGFGEFCSATFQCLGWDFGNLKYFEATLNNLTPKLLPIAIVVIGIMPGIVEELLCRGYIQTRLSQRWGRSVSILVTAALFAILHMDPLQSLFALGLGIYLGVITERTGSIRPAMFAHIANNSLAVLAGSAWGERLNLHIMAAMIVSFVLLLIAVLYLLKYFPARSAPALPELPGDEAFSPLIPDPATLQVPSASPPPLL